jgi:hypothetical protein
MSGALLREPGIHLDKFPEPNISPSKRESHRKRAANAALSFSLDVSAIG